jgi:MYXO-CTERM domain-containing protein
VSCRTSESYHDDTCQSDLCDGVSCIAGRVCDPADGSCVDDRCMPPITCPTGQVCVPTEGTCAEDPCARLRCPTGEICDDGECVLDVPEPDAGMIDAGMVGPGSDAGFDGGTLVEDGHRRILASGFSCTAQRSPSSGLGGFALLALALGLVWRRKRPAPVAAAREGGAR